MKSRKTGQKAVVLVDDDPTEEIIFREYMKNSGVSFFLKVFNTGQKFIEYMQLVKTGKESMPDMALLDIRIPEMDGFEILRAIRSEQQFKSVPKIAAFSNSNEQSDKEKFRTLGADNYFCKPLDGNEYKLFLHNLEEML